MPELCSQEHFPILLPKQSSQFLQLTDQEVFASICLWASLVSMQWGKQLHKSFAIICMSLMLPKQVFHYPWNGFAFYSSKVAMMVIQIKKTTIITKISEIIPLKNIHYLLQQHFGEGCCNQHTNSICVSLSPYHLIWRIVHGFIWVHVHEIHNASEGRQKGQTDPQWIYLERGKKLHAKMSRKKKKSWLVFM